MFTQALCDNFSMFFSIRPNALHCRRKVKTCMLTCCRCSRQWESLKFTILSSNWMNCLIHTKPVSLWSAADQPASAAPLSWLVSDIQTSPFSKNETTLVDSGTWPNHRFCSCLINAPTRNSGVDRIWASWQSPTTTKPSIKMFCQQQVKNKTKLCQNLQLNTCRILFSGT